ncbi:MAG: hypothetical protein H6Q69_4801, partial [Firmicutes bacterium]|nr:hypothetical protein [Bacillota bacterium]
MNTNLKDRFKELLLKLEIGQGKFEELCGMGNGTINNIKIGISSPNLEKISNTFPEINLIWLITGKGEMFIENQTVITDSPTSNKDIKILDIRVCAGHGIGFDGDENKVIGYVNIPEFTGCYGITVYGD